MRKRYLFVALLVLLMPINVFAATGSMSINCSPQEVEPGKTTTCTIKGNVDANISSLDATISISKNVTIQSFTPAEGWRGKDVSNGKIDISIDYDSSDLDHFVNNFDIGTLTIKVNDDHADGEETIGLNNFTYYSTDGPAIATGNASTTFKVKKGVTPEPVVEKGLSSLSVTGGTMTPTFKDDNLGYMVVLNKDTTTFSITAKAKNTEDTISYVNGDTNATINPTSINFTTTGGKSQMSIKITVGSGSNSVIYNLSVVKITESTNSSELASLTIGGNRINIIDGLYDYEITLSNTSNYQVIATLSDPTNYKFENMSFPTTMNGPTEFAIVVAPKDSSSGLKSRTYKITVLAEETPEPVTPPVTDEPPSNPQTGSNTALIMAIVLIISFSVTIYLYKRNIEGMN